MTHFDSSPLGNTVRVDSKNVSRFCHSPLPHSLYLALHCPPHTTFIFLNPAAIAVKWAECMSCQRERERGDDGKKTVRREREYEEGGRGESFSVLGSKEPISTNKRKKKRDKEGEQEKRKRWREG